MKPSPILTRKYVRWHAQASGGCGTNIVTYGTLMKGLGEVGKVDDAWWLMERWENRMRRRVERSQGELKYLQVSQPQQAVPLDLLYSLMNACAEVKLPCPWGLPP